MGGAKRMMEEAEGRGWYSVDKVVCSLCVYDYALVDAIRSEGARVRCSYCGEIPDLPDATAPVDVILELVVDGFRSEYEDPVEQVLWSSADGGYQALIYGVDDLVGNHEVTENGELIRDIEAAITSDAWVKRDPYAASPDEALRWGWKSFREVVKSRRYTFFMHEDDTLGGGEIPVSSVPRAIADAVDLAGQIRVLRAGTRWWRVRVHESHESPTAASDIGTPRDELAKDNRMTPKGVGAFYGASTDSGARAEVAGYASPAQRGTIGEFQLLQDLSVVDLTAVTDMPSLFDADRRHRRASIAFMRDFLDDVARVADPSDKQNLEYIPTQVVAEFFRYGLAGPAGPIRAVLWRSSKDPTVVACVIFASSDAVIDEGASNAGALLMLNPASVRKISGSL